MYDLETIVAMNYEPANPDFCDYNYRCYPRSLFKAEYGSWKNMKRRCYTKTNPRYKNYGGRGITMCQKWKDDFYSFIEDMGTRPTEKHSIGRVDNNIGYCVENCRWETRQQQDDNTSRTIYITANGKTMTITQWAKEVDIPRSTLYSRIFQHGLSHDTAINKPYKPISKIHPGVHFCKTNKKWIARVYINGKRFNVGSFKAADLAIKAIKEYNKPF